MDGTDFLTGLYDDVSEDGIDYRVCILEDLTEDGTDFLRGLYDAVPEDGPDYRLSIRFDLSETGTDGRF